MESMSLKKRNDWLLDYIRQLASNVEECAPLLAPFTMQPYAGMFLYYLLFEEFCSDTELLEKAIKNLSTADYKKIIYLMPKGWTDIPAARPDRNQEEPMEMPSTSKFENNS